MAYNIHNDGVQYIYENDVLGFQHFIQSHLSPKYLNEWLIYAAHHGKLPFVEYLLTADECRDHIDVQQLSCHHERNKYFWQFSEDFHVAPVIHFLLFSKKLTQRPDGPDLSSRIYGITSANYVPLLQEVILPRHLSEISPMVRLIECTMRYKAYDNLQYLLEHTTLHLPDVLAQGFLHDNIFNLIKTASLDTLELFARHRCGIQHLPPNAQTMCFSLSCDHRNPRMLLYLLDLPLQLEPDYIEKTVYNALWALKHHMPDVSVAMLNNLLKHGCFDAYYQHKKDVDDYAMEHGIILPYKNIESHEIDICIE